MNIEEIDNGFVTVSLWHEECRTIAAALVDYAGTNTAAYDVLLVMGAAFEALGYGADLHSISDLERRPFLTLKNWRSDALTKHMVEQEQREQDQARAKNQAIGERPAMPASALLPDVLQRLDRLPVDTADPIWTALEAMVRQAETQDPAAAPTPAEEK